MALGLLREAEHPLPDDVAHHLVGAASHPHPRKAEHELGPRERPPLTGVGDEARLFSVSVEDIPSRSVKYGMFVI